MKTGIVAAALVVLATAIPALSQQKSPRRANASSVYESPFIACVDSEPCTRTANFRVDRVPDGCCVLTVTNGDSRGTDEVSSYEIFLNGERVLPAGRARYANAPVKVRAGDNNLKVVLVGGPHSKIFVRIAYRFDF